MRLESLHIKNYGCLADLELTDLPSLAIFVGANGSGKSTLFDVFAFLRESIRDDVSTALRRRSGLSAVRTMGCGGPIEIEMQVRLDAPDRHGAKRESCLTYQVAIDQDGDRPYVAFERCSYTDDESESIEARVAFEISRDSREAPDDDSSRTRTGSNAPSRSPGSPNRSRPHVLVQGGTGRWPTHLRREGSGR